MRRNELKNPSLYKFVVYQTKGLVSNNRGKPVYMDSFDKVIYELYGIKHFSRKISEYYDDRDIVDLIDATGLEQLIRLMKNTRFCNVVRELTLIDNDTESLEKEIRKMRRKGKSNKHMLREFNDLKKLYEKGIKSLRRRLGIRNAKMAYKRKYAAVRELVGGSDYYDNDDYDFSGLSNVRYRGGRDPYDNDYFDDPYEDDQDYDEYDEDSSELEDFERMLNGPSRKPRRRRVKDPLDSDFYDDDPYARSRDDEEELEEYEEYHLERSMKDKDRLDNLTMHVMELSDCVQALMSQSRYDQVNHRDPVTHLPQKRRIKEYIPPQDNDSELQGEAMESIIEEIESLKDATNTLVDGMLSFQKWQNQINQLIIEEAFDDESDVEMGEPVIDDAIDHYQKIINAYPDVYETPMEELPEDGKEIPSLPQESKNPNQLNHKEVIEEVNRTQAQKAACINDQKKEPQTTARDPKSSQNVEN